MKVLKSKSKAFITRRIVKFTMICLMFSITISLTSCYQNVPEIKTPLNTSYPVITKTKSGVILKNIEDTIAEAHRTHNLDLLKSRTGESAFEIERVKDVIVKKTQKDDILSNFSTDSIQIIISNTKSWPHTFAVIVNSNDKQATEKLMIISQKSPRDQYKLLSYVSLFQNSKLPFFETPLIGSALSNLSDNSLIDQPSNILLKYASFLQDGEKSPFAKDFDEDAFSAEIFKTQNTAQKNLALVNGSQTQTFKFRPEFFCAFHSIDGGALAVAQIDSQWVRHSSNNSKAVPFSDAEQALFEGALTSSISAIYLNLVAIYIPPKGSAKKVQILGGERFPFRVNPL